MPNILSTQKHKLPYKVVELTEEREAAFLLNRFAYDLTLGHIDVVVDIGLEE